MGGDLVTRTGTQAYEAVAVQCLLRRAHTLIVRRTVERVPSAQVKRPNGRNYVASSAQRDSGIWQTFGQHHAQVAQVHNRQSAPCRPLDPGAHLNHQPTCLDNHHRHYQHRALGRSAHSTRSIASAVAGQVSRQVTTAQTTPPTVAHQSLHTDRVIRRYLG